MSLNNKTVATFYYSKVDENGLWQCKCGNKRKQKLNGGYQNLLSHIFMQHPNWKNEVSSENVKINFQISEKTKTIYGWLELIIKNNLPFSFVENEIVKNYCSLPSITVKTLKKYIHLVTQSVENVIASQIPDSFGIMIDGWSQGSDHYLAIFANYLHEDKCKTPLLAISPLLDEEDFSAQSHVHFIKYTLAVFKKGLSNIDFIIADNENLNKAIAN